MDRSEIIAKIKKCLALSKSSNENEAAIALRQAHSLMEKYAIDHNDPELQGITYSEIATTNKMPPSYENHLAQSIAKMMDCMCVYTETHTIHAERIVKHYAWKFVGFDPAPEIASYTFDVLNRQLKKARTTYIKIHLGRVQTKSKKTQRADAFCIGWVLTATEISSKIKPDAEKLTMIESHIMNDLNVESSETRNRNKNLNSSLIDFHKGCSSGKNVDISHAVNANKNDCLLLD